MRQIGILGLAAACLAGSLATAQAQYYDAPYRGGYEERPYRPAPRRPVGLNCDAVQQGITGPQPFSCPLPGPRPLGARCFCDLPAVSFSPPQTAVGRVVP
jgi:hypothetical protein